MWKWVPDPVRCANGFGMWVAMAPKLLATWLVIILKKVTRSAVVSASEYFQLISNWAVPSSWSEA